MSAKPPKSNSKAPPRRSEADLATLRAFGEAIVHSHLQDYLATRNGLHFWRAWAAAREYQLQIPANMLRKIDQVAKKLCKAESQADIAKAVEMEGKKIGTADAEVERHELMGEIWRLSCKANGMAATSNVKPEVPDAVMRDVADRHGIPFENLKVRWSQWWRSRKPAEAESISPEHPEWLNPKPR